MFVGDGRHPLDRQFLIGRFFGIPLYLHLFLVIFLAFEVLNAFFSGQWLRLAWPFLLILSVYLHELGHALSSASFGNRPRRIVLHLFGGVAEVPPGLKRRQELWVIAWGPLVSASLAAASYLALALLTHSLPTSNPAHASYGLLLAWNLARWLFLINLTLFLFNILPIFPLDGGQFLRGLLSLRGGHPYAIRKTLPLSMAVLIVVGFLSLYLRQIGQLGFILALMLLYVNYIEYRRWENLFEDGFWSYLLPGRGSSGSLRTSGGSWSDRLYVWWYRRAAEALMKRADHDGIHNLSPKDRDILSKYLDAKLRLRKTSIDRPN